jgi:hypothetical protein
LGGRVSLPGLVFGEPLPSEKYTDGGFLTSEYSVEPVLKKLFDGSSSLQSWFNVPSSSSEGNLVKTIEVNADGGSFCGPVSVVATRYIPMKDIIAY